MGDTAVAFDGSKPLLSWERVDSIGKKVVNDSGDVAENWCNNNYHYRSGYKCTRKLYDKKKTSFT